MTRYAYTDFDEMERLGFRFAQRGLWKNDAIKCSVWLNEDYKNTFRAVRDELPWYDRIMRNEAGNEIRFRTGHAAAKALIKEMKS